jgi:hypothetical protein
MGRAQKPEKLSSRWWVLEANLLENWKRRKRQNSAKEDRLPTMAARQLVPG